MSKNHGQLAPPEPRQPPKALALPMVLRGNLFLNLSYDEEVDLYGLWRVKIVKRCHLWGKLLEPGDFVELPGAVTQLFVLRGKAVIEDKRLAEEAEIINKAAELGLPQRIREIAAYATPRKKDKFNIRLREDEPD